MNGKTGVVRRMDELGRVVIPKEIRKTMHIKEGEELEFGVEEDALILKKYSPVKNFLRLAEEYADVLRQSTGYACLVCDPDEILVARGKKDWKGKRVTKALENYLKGRRSGFLREKSVFPLVVGETNGDVAIAPIVCGGDVEGGIMLVADGSMSGADTMVKLLSVGADFFAKQIE